MSYSFPTKISHSSNSVQIRPIPQRAHPSSSSQSIASASSALAATSQSLSSQPAPLLPARFVPAPPSSSTPSSVPTPLIPTATSATQTSLPSPSSLSEPDDPQEIFKQHSASLASQPNSVEAIVSVGECYLNGVGIPSDPQKAFEYFQKALKLDKKCLKTQKLIGECYEHGKGVDKDLLMAATHYRHSKEDWNRLNELIRNKAGLLADCIYLVGQCTEKGISTTKDPSLAHKYYSIAANLNHLPARLEIERSGTRQPDSPMIKIIKRMIIEFPSQRIPRIDIPFNMDKTLQAMTEKIFALRKLQADNLGPKYLCRIGDFYSFNGKKKNSIEFYCKAILVGSTAALRKILDKFHKDKKQTSRLLELMEAINSEPQFRNDPEIIAFYNLYKSQNP